MMYSTYAQCFEVTQWLLDYPGRLCTSSPGTLVYTSCQRNKQVVKWLDCSSFPPKTMTTNIKVSYADNHFIQDMCCTTYRQKDLLVTTHSFGGVYAYIAGTDELEWSIHGRQPGMDSSINAVGITDNGRGQLFFCDTSNKCVQMISTDGIFLGTVLRSGRKGLGNPLRIRWCDKTKSLVIAHQTRKLCSISIFRC